MEASKEPFQKTFDGLLYRVARPGDRDAVWQLMLQEFYPKTPLNQHIGGTSAEDVAIEFALPPGLMEQGVTLVVEDPSTKELVGARISCVVPRESSKRHPLVADPNIGAKYPKDSTVYRVLDHLASPVDLYSHYNVDTVLEFKYLVVKQAMRSRNIARNLVDCTIQVARSKGIPVVNVIAAHRHAARIFESMGFEPLNSVLLADYVDPLDGQKPFAELDPDILKDIVLFAKRTHLS